jgi:hypothetical protein
VPLIILRKHELPLLKLSSSEEYHLLNKRIIKEIETGNQVLYISIERWPLRNRVRTLGKLAGGVRLLSMGCRHHWCICAVLHRVSFKGMLETIRFSPDDKFITVTVSKVIQI